MAKKPVLLCIMDGFGWVPEQTFGNAIAAARRPNLDRLFETYPYTTIQASGMAVGLPEGQKMCIRDRDERGAITVEEHDGLPVLALSSELDGERYVQYIYSYGGSLCELFTSARYGFSPEDGEAVCAAQRFEPALEEMCIRDRGATLPSKPNWRPKLELV